MQALHAFRNEARTISYVVLTPVLAGTIGEPTGDDLSKYFEAHKADYRAPEYRAVTIMAMVAKDLAKSADVADEEAKKAYDSQPQRWTTVERRKVEQIVFKDQADADAAATALAGGKTFDDLVIERKLKPADVDLGLVTRDKIFDPKVAEAAFGLAAEHGQRRHRRAVRAGDRPGHDDRAGGGRRPSRGQGRVQAGDRRPSAPRPRSTISRTSIEDARAGGATLNEMSAKYGLKLVTIAAVDKTGKDLDGKPVADLPGGPDLLAKAFQTDVGIENDAGPDRQAALPGTR